MEEQICVCKSRSVNRTLEMCRYILWRNKSLILNCNRKTIPREKLQEHQIRMSLHRVKRLHLFSDAAALPDSDAVCA